MNILVIDTNILISALIKEGLVRKFLVNLNINFIFPDYGLEEIYMHKEEIKEKANLDEKEFNVLLLRILKYVRLIPFDMIFPFKSRADAIIRKIDQNDSVFIALALAFNCPIWSDDKHFKKQKEIIVYTTKEINKIFGR